MKVCVWVYLCVCVSVYMCEHLYGFICACEDMYTYVQIRMIIEIVCDMTICIDYHLLHVSWEALKSVLIRQPDTCVYLAHLKQSKDYIYCRWRNFNIRTFFHNKPFQIYGMCEMCMCVCVCVCVCVWMGVHIWKPKWL